ncbi:metal transporter [Tropicibacter sp. R15_0]|uniref:ion channel n=1 Tax=Tropicibacter sp. R15_0 TaxID=2821101 RepID=UPI001ADCB7E2|nr:ion channel [Tropicibacter sp. R15_0]MBO9467167.1 metal transporter [Tropicibacter sp. R15_0]
MTETLAMFVGICAAIPMGIVHHYALSGILRFSPRRSEGSGLGIILAFSALLLLHVLELVTLAVFNAIVVESVLPQSFGNSPPLFEDILYVTGIAFSTLGYSSLEVAGPFRLLLMLQSLLGFMLLTWSATFLYSACQQVWQKARDD